MPNSIGDIGPRPDEYHVSALEASPRLRAGGSGASPPSLNANERACYDALGLALREGYVFAALTGPASSGKTLVLETVLADIRGSLRCLRIAQPDKVPAQLAEHIEQVAYEEAAKPENADRHVVLAVDDAHLASDQLLHCLTRIAAMREPGRRVPQVLLVGRPELWSRLAASQFEPLARRLAIRAVLPQLEVNDPWSSVEQVLLSRRVPDGPAGTGRSAAAPLDPGPPVPLRASERPRDHFAEAEAATHSLYALFPEVSPEALPQEDKQRRRVLLPTATLLVALAAGTFALVSRWPQLPFGFSWVDIRNTLHLRLSPPLSPDTRVAVPSVQDLPTFSTPAPNPFPLAASIPDRAPSTALVPASEAPAPPPTPPPDPVATTSEPAPSASPPATPAPSATTPAPLPESLATVEQPAPATSAPSTPVASGPSTTPPTAPVIAIPEPARFSLRPSAPAASPPPHEPSSSGLPNLSELTAPVSVPSLPEPPKAVPSQAANSVPSSGWDGAGKSAPLPPKIVALLLRRGDEMFALGDVTAARLLYQRAAEAGSAQGTRLVARTYDNAYLPPSDLPTLADPEAARTWYSRATALGDVEAAHRLQTMQEGR